MTELKTKPECFGSINAYVSIEISILIRHRTILETSGTSHFWFRSQFRREKNLGTGPLCPSLNYIHS
jgi:hypothetical protein